MSANANILATVPFLRAEVKIYTIQYNKVITCRCEKKARAAETTVNEPAAATGLRVRLS